MKATVGHIINNTMTPRQDADIARQGEVDNHKAVLKS